MMTQLTKIVGALLLIAGVAFAGTRLATQGEDHDARSMEAGAADAPAEPQGDTTGAEESPQNAPSEASQTGNPPADDATPAEDDADPGDVFVPTEEISEDFAVSFPVDI